MEHKHRTAAVAALVAATLAATPASARWAASWESAIATLSHGVASGQTIRQFARISVGGTQVRVRVSNETGTKPLRVTDGHVAVADTAPGTVKTSTDHAVTFHGGQTAYVAPGASMLSDPVDMVVPSLSRLAFSAQYFSSSPDQVGHLIASETNYLASGDHAGEAYMQGARADDNGAGYYLSGINVMTPGAAAVVACIGDSITDGLSSSYDKDRRWPDVLAERMATARPNVGVIDAGITGNLVTQFVTGAFGPSASARFGRDVLSRPGVRWVIWLEGVNDINNTDASNGPQMAQALIEAYREGIEQAHEQGIKVIGGTIMPYGGYKDGWTPAREALRQTINAWIRTSGAYDDVVDFDAVMRAPGDQTKLNKMFDSGDGIHPNDAGYQTMGQSIVINNMR